MYTLYPDKYHNVILPERLNCPFYYQPHPLCEAAVEAVRKEIASMTSWEQEVGRGKMFGVLVVRDGQSRIGYLKAYSGQIGGRQDWQGWVPAVFDYLQPDGYFKLHEEEITQINVRIDEMLSSDRHRMNCARLLRAEKDAEEQVAAFRKKMRESKLERDGRRRNGEPEEMLVRESQFQKAELKRLRLRLADEQKLLRDNIRQHEESLTILREERKRLSDSLQAWLFDQFIMLNGRREKRSLTEIFAMTPAAVPPSGAGECCAPKLLQYAFAHSLQPLAMAEFWWGESPVGEIRRHLDYYPACQGKCRPILDYMLQGVDVETNPLEKEEDISVLKVIYEDDALVVIDKPAGMLSVPGKGRRLSAQDILAQQCGGEELYCVHRLDMQTSGLLMFAKSVSVQRMLQRAFAMREVRKVYRAVLEGEHTGDRCGEIDLPLSADYYHRPCQMVDYESGKEALTQYEVLEVSAGRTVVLLSPVTGRTHQLRVHCAHKDGLGLPIVGDDLYGHHSDRLLLHAEKMTFAHPLTGKLLNIECPSPF